MASLFLCCSRKSNPRIAAIRARIAPIRAGRCQNPSPDSRHPSPDSRHPGSDSPHPGSDYPHPSPDSPYPSPDFLDPGRKIRNPSRDSPDPRPLSLHFNGHNPFKLRPLGCADPQTGTQTASAPTDRFGPPPLSTTTDLHLYCSGLVDAAVGAVQFLLPSTGSFRVRALNESNHTRDGCLTIRGNGRPRNQLGCLIRVRIKPTRIQ